MALIELGVNIDHVATLRNARGTTYPDPIRAALLAEQSGADLITLHLREDRRHIKDADLFALRPQITTRMNLECAITAEMLDIACRVKPQDVCLVPEKRQEVTTEGGLDILGQRDQVAAAIRQLHAEGIRVSLFIDPSVEAVEQAHALGATVVELHTGRYADARDATEQTAELARVRVAAQRGAELGLRVNAGHGLHRGNVAAIAQIAPIRELNIGHSIVADAVFDGWEQAVRTMKALMLGARSRGAA